MHITSHQIAQDCFDSRSCPSQICSIHPVKPVTVCMCICFWDLMKIFLFQNNHVSDKDPWPCHLIYHRLQACTKTPLFRNNPQLWTKADDHGAPVTPAQQRQISASQRQGGSWSRAAASFGGNKTESQFRFACGSVSNIITKQHWSSQHCVMVCPLCRPQRWRESDQWTEALPVLEASACDKYFHSSCSFAKWWCFPRVDVSDCCGWSELLVCFTWGCNFLNKQIFLTTSFLDAKNRLQPRPTHTFSPSVHIS